MYCENQTGKVKRNANREILADYSKGTNIPGNQGVQIHYLEIQLSLGTFNLESHFEEGTNPQQFQGTHVFFGRTLFRGVYIRGYKKIIDSRVQKSTYVKISIFTCHGSGR